MKFSKKKFVISIIIGLVFLTPVLLLLNPVLERVQKRIKQNHEDLVQKKKNNEDVSEQWSTLKYRQKVLGDLYRYTFRDQRAIKSYEKYLDWFRKDWETKEYARVKYTTARMCNSIVQEYPSKRAYRKKAACHFDEIASWYKNSGKDYKKLRVKAMRAISTFDLRSHTKRCDD